MPDAPAEAGGVPTSVIEIAISAASAATALTARRRLIRTLMGPPVVMVDATSEARRAIGTYSPFMRRAGGSLPDPGSVQPVRMPDLWPGCPRCVVTTVTWSPRSNLWIKMPAKRLVLPVLPLLLMAATLARTAPASSDDITTVVAAVGDMACDPSNRAWRYGDGTSSACAQKRVSDEVLSDVSLQAVLGLGDYQYDCGDPADYAVSYSPTWGRLDGIMNPVAGNHEYKTGNDVYGQPCPTTNA